MSCELERADATYPGLTFFSRRLARCIKPTAIYFPPKHALASSTLDVVVWLHGYYVKDHRFLFNGDPARVRDQVRDGNKDIILIAPFLGFEHAKSGGGHAGDFSVNDLATAKWGERYLDEILAGITALLSPDAKTPYQLRKLIIACHSGGGGGMRNLVGSLGKYQSSLAACWGFDCLYGALIKPDDASFWYDWARGASAKLDIVYGPSTLPQSVKLDLMARGFATADGDRAEPRRPTLANVKVTIGHASAAPAFGQMVKVNDLDRDEVDRLMVTPGGATRRSPAKPHGEFLDEAIANVRKAVAFDADIHYIIARDAFLGRLRGL